MSCTISCHALWQQQILWQVTAPLPSSHFATKMLQCCTCFEAAGQHAQGHAHSQSVSDAELMENGDLFTAINNAERGPGYQWYKKCALLPC